jgi:hypothetical protein
MTKRKVLTQPNELFPKWSFEGAQQRIGNGPQERALICSFRSDKDCGDKNATHLPHGVYYDWRVRPFIKLHYLLGCVLAAGSLVVFPDIAVVQSWEGGSLGGRTLIRFCWIQWLSHLDKTFQTSSKRTGGAAAHA